MFVCVCVTVTDWCTLPLTPCELGENRVYIMGGWIDR